MDIMDLAAAAVAESIKKDPQAFMQRVAAQLSGVATPVAAAPAPAAEAEEAPRRRGRPPGRKTGAVKGRRGRPRKAAVEAASETPAGEGAVEEAPAATEAPRRRGRPRKAAVEGADASGEEAVPRRRGRRLPTVADVSGGEAAAAADAAPPVAAPTPANGVATPPPPVASTQIDLGETLV